MAKIIVLYMKKVKKALRLFAFVLLIILASSGIGGIPVIPSGKKQEGAEIQIDFEESESEQNENENFDVFKY